MAISPLMSSATSNQSTAKATSSTSDTSTATATSNNTLGNSADELLNNFMTLLITQMQNQDPTNPIDRKSVV